MKNLLFLILPMLVAVIGNSQNNQNPIYYEDEYNVEAPIEQSSNSGTVCEGQRKDASNLPIEDQETLAGLILDYLTSVENPNFQSGDPEFLRWDIVAKHSAYNTPGPNGHGEWHSNNETFFSWHRDYIQGLEQFLLENGHPEFVPLPAWNPSNPIPLAFQAVVPGLGSLNNTDPQANMYEVDDITCEQFESLGIDGFAGFIRAGSSNPTGASFTSHNNVHSTINGTMGTVSTASGAVIFWLFHAHVDELYQCYQTRCQECEPVFIRATHKGNGCNYCFDFSLNVNVVTIDIMLIDEDGTERSITLSKRKNCVPYYFMESGKSYTVRIEGNNATNALCSAKDIVEIDFVAPVQPMPTPRNPHPCGGVLQTEQFPTSGFHPNNGGGMKSFKVKNTGDTRSFTFYNTVTQSGLTSLISSQVELESGEEILVTIPSNYVGYGGNYFVTEVEGETYESQYFVLNN